MSNKYLEKIAAFTDSKGRSIKDTTTLRDEAYNKAHAGYKKVKDEAPLFESKEARRAKDSKVYEAAKKSLDHADVRDARISEATNLLAKKKSGIRNKKIGIGLGAAALGVAAYKGLKKND